MVGLVLLLGNITISEKVLRQFLCSESNNT